MGERDEKDHDSTLAALTRTSGHGLTLALATGLFLLVGWWLDGRIGTTPVLTILGALTGATAGFYSMYQHLVLFPRRKEREAEERKAGTGRERGGAAAPERDPSREPDAGGPREDPGPP